MPMVPNSIRRAASSAAGAVVAIGVAASGYASADAGQVPPRLPVFTPGPSDWSPNFALWPYSTFTDKVTPEMIGGMSDSCQWFNAQYDPLMGQANDFENSLRAHGDNYSGVQAQANAVVANLDQSTGFLGPRLQPLTIRNNLDNYGPYSPIYGGEQITSVMFQLSSISESIKKQDVSGVLHAHVVHAFGWGNALRDSGACA